ncbi:uncharacterized protein IL334_002834 [Kwoniella shivajii]|uniref:WD40 repeat-like protein n=1 Tax=Kwoniella shivajii TaxID=564305 RepID=A0ABZ1CVV4_9TREE|nr:hypothetical protein IL334_002834 [Kwoniella shivajii]
MVSYSGDQLRKDFVYSTSKDYVTPSGESAHYVQGHPKSFGDELTYIPFEKKVGKRDYGPLWSFNHTHTLFASGTGKDIHIYTIPSRHEEAEGIEKGKLIQTLSGHTGRLHLVSFIPGQSNRLVSFSEQYGYPDSDLDEKSKLKPKPKSEIIFWDLDNIKSPSITDQDILTTSKKGLESISDHLQSLDFNITPETKEEIEQTVYKLLSREHIDQLIPSDSKINGRLTAHFGSPIFNNKGDKMVYMPGDRPKSNGDDKWDLCLYDITTRKTIQSFIGHRDAIMWIGFSPDDTLLASVAWDKSIRIWDVDNGEEKYKFETENQNWAGKWSFDGKFFFGTCGSGPIRIWNIDQGGQLVWEYNYKEWCRAIDWSLDGKYLALGGKGNGKIIVFNVGSIFHPSDSDVIDSNTLMTTEQPESIEQEQEKPKPFIAFERTLDISSLPKDVVSFAGSMISIGSLSFLPPSTGLKLVSNTGAESAIEMFDLETKGKRRFVQKNEDDLGQVRGWEWLEERKEFVTVHGDGLRFWNL